MPIETSILVALPLFKGLSTTELEEFASRLEERSFPAGEEIITEGSNPGTPLYILLHGAVEVVKRGPDGRGHVISSLQAPSVFGEVEILAQRKPIAGVNAVTEIKTAVLGRGVFDEMCHANRPCTLKVVRNLAQVLSYRLAATDERLAAHFELSVPGIDEQLVNVRNIMYSSWRMKEGS